MAATTTRTKNGNGTKTRARTTRTRAEVASEFEDISGEVSSREPEDAKTAAAKKGRADEVRKAVGQLTPETVVQRISAVTVDVSKVLAGVQQTLLSAVEEYKTTSEGVVLLKEELNELHQKDIAATALDQLVQDYEIKARDLEVEIQTRKLDWEKEQQDRSRSQREFDDNLTKSRKRESDDYSYRTAQERKKLEDDFTEQSRLKAHENREKQELLERNWASREEILKKQETETADLRAKVQAFPVELDAAVKKAEAIKENVLKKHYETQIQLLTKDKETDARVAAAEIANLKEASTRQVETIAQLQRQLDASRQQVEAIAGKALDSASGRSALQHVQEVIKDTQTPAKPSR